MYALSSTSGFVIWLTRFSSIFVVLTAVTAARSLLVIWASWHMPHGKTHPGQKLAGAKGF